MHFLHGNLQSWGWFILRYIGIEKNTYQAHLMVRKQIKDDFMWCFGTPVRNLQNSCSRHSGKSEFLSDAHGISGSSWVYVTIDKTVRFPISHVDRTNTPALIGHVLSKHLFSKKNRYIIFLDLDLGPSVSPVVLLSPRREPQIDKLVSSAWAANRWTCQWHEPQIHEVQERGSGWLDWPFGRRKRFQTHLWPPGWCSLA
jgi:hypothetical protein